MALFECKKASGDKIPKIVDENNDEMQYITATTLATPSTKDQTVTSGYYTVKDACKMTLKLEAFSGSSSYNSEARFYVNDVRIESTTRSAGAKTFEHTFNANDTIKIDCYISGVTYVRSSTLTFVKIENI